MKAEHRKYILENINKKSVKDIAAYLSMRERNVKKFLNKYKEKEKFIEREKDDAAAPRPMNKWAVLTAVILIIILGFAVYANTFKSPFIWDDINLVKNNPLVKNWSYISGVFTKNIGAGVGLAAIAYRPVQVVTYIIDYHFWQLNPLGYHITNASLHILAALAIFWMLNIIFNNIFISALTGILFVIHPIHTEAVTYISGRADSLSAVFMFLAFIFYLKNLRSQTFIRYALIALTYAAAILSRESALILPVIILLYHYAFKKKIKTQNLPLILTVTAAYLFFRAMFVKAPAVYNLVKTTFPERVPGFFIALTEYMRLLFLPLNLHMEYGNMLFDFSDFRAVLGVMILLFLLSWAFIKRGVNKLVFFSILWFIVTLLPQSNLYPSNAYMAEHWLYIPSIGFFLVISAGINYLYNNKKFKVFAAGLFVFLMCFYSFLTVRQNTYWGNAMSFYKQTLKYAPTSPRLCNDYAVACVENSKIDEAVKMFKKAMELDPNYAEPRNNLGYVYVNSGRPQDAIALFKKAIEINPAYATAYSNLAGVYQMMGRKDKAIQAYRKSLELNPYNQSARDNLAGLEREK